MQVQRAISKPNFQRRTIHVARRARSEFERANRAKDVKITKHSIDIENARNKGMKNAERNARTLERNSSNSEECILTNVLGIETNLADYRHKENNLRKSRLSSANKNIIGEIPKRIIEQ